MSSSRRDITAESKIQKAELALVSSLILLFKIFSLIN